MDDRLIELETKIAFQEDTIQHLSDELIRQGREMEQLRLEMEVLKDRVRGMAVSLIASQAEETPPPHY